MHWKISLKLVSAATYDNLLIKLTILLTLINRHLNDLEVFITQCLRKE